MKSGKARYPHVAHVAMYSSSDGMICSDCRCRIKECPCTVVRPNQEANPYCDNCHGTGWVKKETV